MSSSSQTSTCPHEERVVCQVCDRCGFTFYEAEMTADELDHLFENEKQLRKQVYDLTVEIKTLRHLLDKLKEPIAQITTLLHPENKSSIQHNVAQSIN